MEEARGGTKMLSFFLLYSLGLITYSLMAATSIAVAPLSPLPASKDDVSTPHPAKPTPAHLLSWLTLRMP
jgi:hypothetical protein